MRRLSLITPYFWPEVISCVPLMASLAEDMVAAGWEVDVLTVAPASWDDGQRVSSEGSRPANSDRFHGARVFRQPNPFSRRPGPLWKLLEYVWFTVWIVRRLLFGRKYDAIFVYSNPPLMGLPVSWIGRLRGAPVLYNLQDLFPGTAVRGGLLRENGPLYRCLRGLEKRTYRSVDRVVAISDAFVDHVRSVEPLADVRAIPNWVDTEVLRPVPPEENRFLRNFPELADKFIVLYSGNLGFLHGLDALIDAAEALQDIEDLLVLIIGDGQRAGALRKSAERRNLTNVRFLDFQPFSMVPDVYSAGDIGLVPMRRGATSTAIPSKCWSIMAAGRPILAGIEADSELAELIVEERAGVVVEPEAGAPLATAIRRLYGDAEARRSMGRNGRRFVELNRSRRTVVARYQAELAELASGTGRAQDQLRDRPISQEEEFLSR